MTLVVLLLLVVVGGRGQDRCIAVRLWHVRLAVLVVLGTLLRVVLQILLRVELRSLHLEATDNKRRILLRVLSRVELGRILVPTMLA